QEENPKIGAYLSVCAQRAQAQARALDALPREEKYTTPLWGIPFALKDNICTKDLPTTCGSKMLENFIAPYDATVTRRLYRAGGVLLGKTNMDEFAMGNTTELSAFCKTQNPIAPGYVPGGSSGGSAAAVASLQAPYALGSDTGGSVRHPAACCALVGLKPTYGRVSRYGLVAFASSLEQVGVLTRSVRENAAVFSVLNGQDARDATSRAFAPFEDDLCEKKGVAGLRIALPVELLDDQIDSPVKKQLLLQAKAFEKLGATVEEVHLPDPTLCLAAYYVISCAEASSNLARFDGVRYGRRSQRGADPKEIFSFSRGEGFGGEVKKRILFGTYVLSAGHRDDYYEKALMQKRRATKAVKELFERYDLILCPTAPTLPQKMGAFTDAPFYKGDLCTVFANLTGIPALTLPTGQSEQGLAVGVQLMASHGREDLLYRGAYALEQEGTYAKL
ncbi:MAG: Asp-tRNA(Asn)/Glu-tRNA(Gln) amidotransferase subunit GatA, partial [Clostridia bacterium]|nr:Asp-tRNA(Asn)/Glu-tRNA(Gln) amidotransferase subunit GatA [Clostridia bacterium]